MTTISKEEENNVRLYLLLSRISPRAVRAVFDREFNPACLNVSIHKSRIKLEQLRQKSIINQSQWNLLFPSNGRSDSQTFDITLMITLLTNLTQLSLCNIAPLETDKSQSDDLARIRNYRNHISHVTLNGNGKIESAYFTEAWNDISGAIGRLGGQDMFTECTELKTKCLDTSTVPWNIRVQIMQILEDWQLNDANFVETRAAKRVLECVKKTAVLLLLPARVLGKQ
ncbi:unnamed protein product [Mytilus coruscus]|uniref:DZIP3-like HEPN domain-containing protein n=1 Tax=Mytilus coruscus TaxID=42192 RepID=A0A6J8B974_MYTCO|nr:unnamed protein product [Mytilus coruscus]